MEQEEESDIEKAYSIIKSNKEGLKKIIKSLFFTPEHVELIFGLPFSLQEYTITCEDIKESLEKSLEQKISNESTLKIILEKFTYKLMNDDKMDLWSLITKIYKDLDSDTKSNDIKSLNTSITFHQTINEYQREVYKLLVLNEKFSTYITDLFIESLVNEEISKTLIRPTLSSLPEIYHTLLLYNDLLTYLSAALDEEKDKKNIDIIKSTILIVEEKIKTIINQNILEKKYDIKKEDILSIFFSDLKTYTSSNILFTGKNIITIISTKYPISEDLKELIISNCHSWFTLLSQLQNNSIELPSLIKSIDSLFFFLKASHCNFFNKNSFAILFLSTLRNFFFEQIKNIIEKENNSFLRYYFKAMTAELPKKEKNYSYLLKECPNKEDKNSLRQIIKNAYFYQQLKLPYINVNSIAPREYLEKTAQEEIESTLKKTIHALHNKQPLPHEFSLFKKVISTASNSSKEELYTFFLSQN
jgi:hypothetical protein